MQLEACPRSRSDRVKARLSWSWSNTYVAAVACRVPRARRKVRHPAPCEWGGRHVLGPGAVETAGDVREVTSPHILVSAAPFWCSPEESWEQSVSWLALPAPFPPCSSLGQKGRHWTREDVQDLVPIPQGRL